jgi:hypothetical protein
MTIKASQLINNINANTHAQIDDDVHIVDVYGKRYEIIGYMHHAKAKKLEIKIVEEIFK